MKPGRDAAGASAKGAVAAEALFVPDGDGFRPTDATLGPWGPTLLHGGAVSALCLEGQLVGFWLRTRRAIRPVAVHAGWRTSPSVAVQVVLQAVRKARTPEPIRRARTVARRARGAATLGRAM